MINIPSHPLLTPLCQAYDQGRLPPAIALVGPQGVGKRRVADALIQRILGHTTHHQALISAGTHPDLCCLDGAPIEVSSVRSIEGFLSQKSVYAPTKVVMIDTLDAMNRFGLNALLKVVEDPPSLCVFILLAHTNRALIPTLRSRCQVMTLVPGADQGQSEVEDPFVNWLIQGRPGLAEIFAEASAPLTAAWEILGYIFIAVLQGAPFPMAKVRELGTILKAHPSWGVELLGRWVQLCIQAHTGQEVPWLPEALRNSVQSKGLETWLDLWDSWIALCEDIQTLQADWALSLVAWLNIMYTPPRNTRRS